MMAEKRRRQKLRFETWEERRMEIGCRPLCPRAYTRHPVSSRPRGQPKRINCSPSPPIWQVLPYQEARFLGQNMHCEVLGLWSDRVRSNPRSLSQQSPQTALPSVVSFHFNQPLYNHNKFTYRFFVINFLTYHMTQSKLMSSMHEINQRS